MSANDAAAAAWEDYINQQQEEELLKLQERIKQLEDRIDRASKAFFNDGSDASVANGMIKILDEERGNVSKEPLQSDSSIWAKAGIGFTTEGKP